MRPTCPVVTWYFDVFFDSLNEHLVWVSNLPFGTIMARIKCLNALHPLCTQTYASFNIWLGFVKFESKFFCKM